MVKVLSLSYKISVPTKSVRADFILRKIFHLPIVLFEPHKSPENMRDATVAYMTKLHEYEPFSLQDWNTEMQVLDMLFSDSFIASLDDKESHMEFSAMYLDSITSWRLYIL